jgi:5'-methylthioadenosine phosphorylase
MSERLGITGGSSFLEGNVLDDATETRVGTDYGEVTVHEGPDYVFLARHGTGVYHPPHRIPHHAHATAFGKLGVSTVVGLNSVGSLDPDLGPGTVVVANDYLSVHPPPTFAGDERLHIVPTLDSDLRDLLLRAARATEGPVVDGGVYVETRGPRFETRAEIRWLAGLGDVIGMTAASEATLFQERWIDYAMLGIVDNYANGITGEPLTFEEYEAHRLANVERANAILETLIRFRRSGESE